MSLQETLHYCIKKEKEISLKEGLFTWLVAVMLMRLSKRKRGKKDKAKRVHIPASRLSTPT